MGGGPDSRCEGRVYGLDGDVSRHHPNRTHDLRCNLASSAPDDGRMRPKHV